MLKNLASVPVGDEVEDVDLNMLNEIESETLGLPKLELGLESDTDGLGALGRRGRRRRKGGRARARRAKARARRLARKKTKAQIRRAASRRAKMMPRSKKGRFVKLSGLGKARRRRARRRARVHGLAGLNDIILLENQNGVMEDGLGRAGRKRRRKGAKARRRGGRARARRARRSRRSSSFAGLADASAALSDAEVLSSTPVLGMFEWLGTRAGLEAMGGAAIAPIVSSLVSKGLFTKVFQMNTSAPLGDTAASLTSAVAIWELGKLIGSGNIAKFGAFSVLSALIDRQIVQPYIMKHLPLGDDGILFPEKKRPDYAVNPLSEVGTVRIPDDQAIGQVRLFENQDLVNLGTVRVPDDQAIGTVRVPDDQAIGQDEEAEEVGQFEDEFAESSELF